MKRLCFFHHCKGLIVLILFLLPLPVFGAVNSGKCLLCHNKYKGFVHGNVACEDCHKDATSLPHNNKLAKPSCGACHPKIEKEYSKSIHGTKKVECKGCHDVHFVDKGKKSCNECHDKISHISLLSREKHLAALGCLACHSLPASSSIKVNILAKDKGLIKKESVDLDRNSTLSLSEWDNLQSLLQQSAIGDYKIQKEYPIVGNVHTITKEPQPCKSCHNDRRLFKQAQLQFNGAVPFKIPVDPSIFIPEIPDLDSYRKTVHGEKGVRCSDCHVSQKSIDDSVCIKCHKDIYKVYRNTVHAQKGATKCTDCHNPHRIEAYKELNAQERVAVCSPCHKDYIQKHQWLPNTRLHFDHLECTACHSPESAKSIVFRLSARKGDKEEIITYKTLENLYGKTIAMTLLVDKNRDEVMDSRELTDFFTDVRKRLAGNAFIGSSIVVTRLHHDYSGKRQKERICASCHSEAAPFYEAMFFVLPEDGYHRYFPVKGTILSAIPVSVFIDMSLLGGQKATWADVKGFFALKPGEFTHYAQELGFKWIDIIGISLGFVIVFFILFHILARLSVKK
jgi:predicted CXXCH cytochrome family protein